MSLSPVRRWAASVAAATALLGTLTLAGPALGAPAASSPPDGAAPAAAPVDEITIGAELLASGLRRPSAMAAPDDGSGRLFITQKAGSVVAYHPDTGVSAPLLNITDRVDESGNERGLIGIATPPDFASDPALYVVYTALPDGAVTLSRFPMSSPGQTTIPAGGEQILLSQEHAEFSNHNGGQIAFGPDGNLYWSIGDGGGSGDPFAAGQDLGTLLGKILRLDVSRSCGAQPYCVPADNPFVGTAGARPEIWAYGLRNAWRFSFDDDGSLWIADVGQGGYEEVNHNPGNEGGLNYGWSCMEGPEVFLPERCTDGAEYTEPSFWYRTTEGNCAVIGGQVYRGERYADIAGGTYITGDYCSGQSWAVRPGAGGYESASIGELPIQVTTFGEGADGELYVITDLPGQLHAVTFEGPAATGDCTVGYRVTSQWGTGFSAQVLLTNTGTEPVSGWQLGWRFTAGQRVSSGWNGSYTTQGDQVTVSPAAWNATIAPGQSVQLGFNGTHTGSNPAPQEFTLNGAVCATG
ncbi:PQQ-dependent sugar dehydrogenase [Allonocardiopsis opalescens]|uniref:Glucose/arabinose dehydrogenase n=1 Tax=Allonocardiopsis opalescens TaxID=1144618 RepID=A0A2T0PX57_9ACTN|nr:PQQ-dependent sugar dehydrogenase [Allonocardiopsis opalescens]PRX96117.1 glucose/arabinose dehydrogenase [Allonocardiopsis opalescens]